MDEKITVLVVKVEQRVQEAAELQALFTKYGCNIRMRLGLHDAGDVCSNQGLIILQLAGERSELEAFEKELGEVRGVTAKAVRI